MRKISLVTGANGHLGNNLLRHLLNQGEKVRAGIRSTQHSRAFAGLDCEIVPCDLLQPQSLEKALEGVDVLYQVAAVYKRWARDPQKEIYEANLRGTENIIRAAAGAGVKKIIYISSAAALDRNQQPLQEGSWNPLQLNTYEHSKTASEQLALKLARELGIPLVSILPHAMIGGHFFSLTPSLAPFEAILKKEMPFDPNMPMMFVDVADVARACYAAVERGKAGERYLISCEESLPSRRLFELAAALFPERKLKVPPMAPRWLLMLIARLAELASGISKSAPVMTVSDVQLIYNFHQKADITKARKVLGLELTPMQESLRSTFCYIEQHFLENKTKPSPQAIGRQVISA